MSTRSVLAFLLAQGISILVAWAGLHYDNALFYVGVTLIALVLILFVHSWAFPKVVPVLASNPALPEPKPADAKEKALFTLKKARDNAVVAIAQGTHESRGRAYHEIIATMLSIKREFDIGPMQFKSEEGLIPYKEALRGYVEFIDRIYPLLREGHLATAKSEAANFNCTFG